MKLFSMVAVASFMFSTAAFAADPVLGLWKTQPDDNGNFGYVDVTMCGAKICGSLTKAFDGSGAEMDSDNVGKAVIWDMVKTGNGSYGKGTIHSFDRDQDYSSKMQLNGNSMVVKGCALGGLVCRGQTWTRVN